jgi:hypothetical protein
LIDVSLFSDSGYQFSFGHVEKSFLIWSK